ncbi:MAG: alpha/beta hydrolase family protein, partial [Muribaculaceae bacterium]|nr:alpha/beta hydrolase family protein [Muribaculaceae bacterium]
MRFKTLLLGLVTGFGAFASDPIDKTLDVSSREDGMLTSSISHVRSLMRANGPKLRFNPAMPADSFPAWQAKMSEAMTRLMKHPDYQPAAPKMVKEVARPGYRLQRWETYPLPESMVAVNVLIPDGISEENPAKGAVICIPGFGQTKELLCGEEAGNYDLSRPQPEGDPAKAAMARHFADKGLIAVAVDNVSAGELSDNGHFDYLLTSRYLLELGGNYLGRCAW